MGSLKQIRLCVSNSEIAVANRHFPEMASKSIVRADNQWQKFAVRYDNLKSTWLSGCFFRFGTIFCDAFDGGLFRDRVNRGFRILFGLFRDGRENNRTEPQKNGRHLIRSEEIHTEPKNSATYTQPVEQPGGFRIRFPRMRKPPMVRQSWLREAAPVSRRQRSSCKRLSRRAGGCNGA